MPASRPLGLWRLLPGLALAAALLAPVMAEAAEPSPTVQAIRARGRLVCGMQGDNPPFSVPDGQGVWRGIDVTSCRALAAAVLGDPDKVTIRPVTGLTRFPSVQSGEVDVLFGSTTWVTTRETALGLSFASTNYYSGQGFLVRTSLGVQHVKDLNGASICVPPGSTTELVLQDWFRQHDGTFQPVIIDDPNQIQAAFLSGRCDAYTRDLTGLAGFRARQTNPSEFLLLPEFISMEPLGAFVRKGDNAWFDVVRWTGYALVAAEQMGVTGHNIEEQKRSPSPDVRRLLGVEGEVGPSMGLDREWAARAIRAAGNYGEAWDRDIKPMGIERGLNRLWNEGGLQFSPPLR
ncbi:amino acid ABC transporter substrate-binding protein [Roseomonas indoligenes]|uniref:Amino acid ABC transporter substrate-binding protein n=1 Tax=Roseomonas indoligenes TaxID=2820811 RepID=A0A940MVA5_9PROT|nr:amino acid ABC transporter substrate-binding protein [Pararoseomonas indoligenes]MBP0491882.1 amino acid ABC transporter substrate-binding protein [Pararoseomonas indoligenes]